MYLKNQNMYLDVDPSSARLSVDGQPIEWTRLTVSALGKPIDPRSNEWTDPFEVVLVTPDAFVGLMQSVLDGRIQRVEVFIESGTISLSSINTYMTVTLDGLPAIQFFCYQIRFDPARTN